MLKGLKEFMRSRKVARSHQALDRVYQSGSGQHAKVGGRGPSMRGYVVVETRKPGEGWELHDEGENLVLTQAEPLVADAMIGVASSFINYLELGDPSPATNPALTNTILEQTTSVNKVVSRTKVGNVAAFEATFLTSEGNGFTYTEAGLFVGTLGAGTLFARKIFNPIVKTAAFELKITWYITFLVNDLGGVCSGVQLVGPTQLPLRHTTAAAVGGETSVTTTFDFAVSANQMIVWMNNGLLKPGVEYAETASGGLTVPILGIPTNKGINLTFAANPGDVFHFFLLTLA